MLPLFVLATRLDALTPPRCAINTKLPEPVTLNVESDTSTPESVPCVSMDVPLTELSVTLSTVSVQLQPVVAIAMVSPVILPVKLVTSTVGPVIETAPAPAWSGAETVTALPPKSDKLECRAMLPPLVVMAPSTYKAPSDGAGEAPTAPAVRLTAPPLVVMDWLT